jgi:hypothetical protein
MLSLMALAYNSARLAFEAQNAAAIGVLRLVSGTRNRKRLDQVIPHTIALPSEALPSEVSPAPVKPAPTRSLTSSRVQKKSGRSGNRQSGPDDGRRARCTAHRSPHLA